MYGQGPVVELDLEAPVQHVHALVCPMVGVAGDVSGQRHLEHGEPSGGVGTGGLDRERGRHGHPAGAGSSGCEQDEAVVVHDRAP
jgi:hypothetical protein